jgi:hypothetical protein
VVTAEVPRLRRGTCTVVMAFRLGFVRLADDFSDASARFFRVRQGSCLIGSCLIAISNQLAAGHPAAWSRVASCSLRRLIRPMRPPRQAGGMPNFQVVHSVCVEFATPGFFRTGKLLEAQKYGNC